MSTRAQGPIDPVTLTIVNNSFVSICREMGITMMRTAFSPIFNEGLDFSCVLFDRRGNMIGQAEFCPAQLGASLFIVRWTVEELGIESFEPGDVVLHNDPYRGGAHLPEHSVIRPVFYEDELFGFVANVGHLAEIGGKAVGGFAADATEVFQEGLRIPPVKIVSGDENNMELWKLIMANHRTPRNTWGDLNAQIGSLRVAERRVVEMLDRFGRDLVESSVDELLDYSERGGNTETHPKLADMVIGALAPALPDRVAAAEGGSACNFLFGGFHPKTGDYYANYHLEGGGWGAKSYDDGNDAIIVKNGNCRNTPVEIFETRYPLRVVEYSLMPDSGGPGRKRGGLGTRRIMRVGPGAEITANALLDRTKPGFGAWGLEGGGKGGRGAILVKRKGESEFRTFTEVFGTVSASKFTNILLEEGDEVLIDSPGGGGFGDPHERDRELLRRDLYQGFVSEAAANEIYGFEG